MKILLQPLNEMKGCRLFCELLFCLQNENIILNPAPMQAVFDSCHSATLLSAFELERIPRVPDSDSCHCVQISNIIDPTELAPPRAQVCANYIPCTVVKDLFIIPPGRQAFRHRTLAPTLMVRFFI